MKKFFLILPVTKSKIVITVDDQDAYRLRGEPWLIRRAMGSLQVYRKALGVNLSLAREILGVSDEGLCVIHVNNDATDFRRVNLKIISKAELLERARDLKKSNTKYGYCVRGHALTPENIMDNGYNGSCKTCHMKARRRSYQKRKRTHEFMAEA